MSEIVADDGGDAVTAIHAKLEEMEHEFGRDIMQFWFEQSQRWLAEAAEQRAELGRQHGRQGRAQTGLHAIHNSAIPPQYDETTGDWTFSYPHEGAVFQEFGAIPHEIRAKEAEALAFEWPDQPDEIREQFEHTEGDLVFFESISHPGIPAIAFVRRSRDITRERLRARGIEVEDI